MDKLIKAWEILAEKYILQAKEHTNSYTTERLFASADTLQVCADQLRRLIKTEHAEK